MPVRSTSKNEQLGWNDNRYLKKSDATSFGVTGAAGYTGVQGVTGPFGGPQGATGIIGPAGNTGSVGARGVTGPLASFTEMPSAFVEVTELITDSTSYVTVATTPLTLTSTGYVYAVFSGEATSDGVTDFRVIIGDSTGASIRNRSTYQVFSVDHRTGSKFTAGTYNVYGQVKNAIDGTTYIVASKIYAQANTSVGVQGATGLSGSDGTSGAAGSTGLQGITGLGLANFYDTTAFPAPTPSPVLLWNSTNEALYMGNTGVGHWVQISAGTLRGVTGPAGAPQGVTGAAGLGYTGLQGLTGLRGSIGYSGNTGIQGDTGASVLGATGLMGPTGVQGTQGVTGGYVIWNIDNGKANTNFGGVSISPVQGGDAFSF